MIDPVYLEIKTVYCVSSLTSAGAWKSYIGASITTIYDPAAIYIASAGYTQYTYDTYTAQ